MNIQLYHRESCPFCATVREVIHLHHLDHRIDFLDVGEDSQAYDDLVEITGDEQVPCLVVEGSPILESEMIIAWLDDHEDEIIATPERTPSFQESERR